MPYLQAYQLQYTNTENVLCKANLYNTASGLGTTVFTQIEGTESAVSLFTVNNDEDKFSPIRALQCEIKFLSTATINLNTFIGTSDNQWYVELIIGPQVVFKGFAVLDDMDEDFLDSDTSNIVTIIATDNVGTLKDAVLTKPDGTNPRGHFNIITYISWCLSKTGLSLPINVVHNVKEEHSPTKVVYESGYLHSKTFERDINESEDCYTVLEAILKEDAFLTQAAGEWWIVRVDEMESSTYVNHFTSAGAWIAQNTFDAVRTFAPDTAMYFSENATFVKIQQPAKEVSLTYDYRFPREIVDNIDYSRGALLTDLGNEKRYALDDWTTEGGPTAFVKRIFEDGYEKERYIVIPLSTGSQEHFILSSEVPLSVKDKFMFGFDWRLTTNLTSGPQGNIATAQVRLYGDDGTNWTLTNRDFSYMSGSVQKFERPGNWIQTNSTFTTNNRYIFYQWNREAINETDFINVSAESDPVPVSGTIRLLIREFSGDIKRETHIANIRLNYTPYINGSYQKYSAQRSTVRQAVNTKKTVSVNVDISDSPKKLFKGALFYKDGSTYKLIGQVYDGRQFTLGVPAAEFLHPFSYNQLFCLWNQNNRPFRIFDFGAQGLGGSTNLPDSIERYTIGITHPHSTGKQFMLLHQEYDISLCAWKGVMAEVHDNAIPKDYTSAFDFKYVGE